MPPPNPELVVRGPPVDHGADVQAVADSGRQKLHIFHMGMFLAGLRCSSQKWSIGVYLKRGE